MGGCTTNQKQIDKSKRRVHFDRRMVVKVHKVKLNAADSRKCIWYVPRTLEIQEAIDKECDALLGENKIHFRKIKDSIERQSIERRVIDAIQRSRSETVSRNKLLDKLDGVSLAVLALSKLQTAADKMKQEEQLEKNSHSETLTSVNSVLNEKDVSVEVLNMLIL